MVRGKSIRIYLAAGNVSGIRHAEVVNWTGQAIALPRHRLSELSSWEESKTPGVYLLFGEEENSIRPKVYIGEAEKVFDRLQSHISSKDFWNEVILFTNKDKNLTKSHIKYLESRLVEISNNTKRYVVDNSTIPQVPTLPRGDTDSMEEFIDNIRLLLGVLGHRLLEPLTSTVFEPSVITGKADESKTSVTIIPKQSTLGIELFFQLKDIKARGLTTDEGLVVYEKSIASKKVWPSLSYSYKILREELIAQNILIEQQDYLVFNEDYLFKSFSAAGCIISGQSINGRDYWKNNKGQSINEIERNMLQ